MTYLLASHRYCRCLLFIVRAHTHLYTYMLHMSHVGAKKGAESGNKAGAKTTISIRIHRIMLFSNNSYILLQSACKKTSGLRRRWKSLISLIKKHSHHRRHQRLQTCCSTSETNGGAEETTKTNDMLTRFERHLDNDVLPLHSVITIYRHTHTYIWLLYIVYF